MQKRLVFRAFWSLFVKFVGIYVFLLMLASWCSLSFGQLISQYIETNSGTTPKGIEVWNNTGSNIVFSTTNNLRVFQGTNGGGCAQLSGLNITSGVLEAGKVWVIGTSNLTTFANTNGTSLSGTTTYAFTFNGNDALQLYLGTTLKDVIGTCGSDPGSAWSGGGVSTADQNISILSSISTGTTTNWSNPSLRFENTANGSTMTGFGNAPVASCTTPDMLAFEVQPTDVQQNATMTAVKVKAICSASGGVATSYAGAVTLSVNAPGCGYMSQTVAAVNGIATFSAIQILRSPQVNITFTASASGFSPVTSTAFQVTAPGGTPVVTTIAQNNFDAVTNWNYSIGTPTEYGSGGSSGVDVTGIVAQSGSNVLRKSYSVSNGSGERGSINTVTFDNVVGLSAFDHVDFSFQVFSFGSGVGAGVDNGDDFLLEVSTDGGITWMAILTQQGSSDRLFGLSASPVTSLALTTNSVYTKPDTKSAFLLTLTGVSQFQFRFTAKNNRTNENWGIDHVLLQGTTVPPGVAFPLPSVDVGSDLTFCSGNAVQLSAQVASFQAPISYSWTNASQLSSGTIQNPLATPLGATEVFEVTVTDAHLCQAVDALQLVNAGFGGTHGLWTGAFDENWFDCRNWSDGQIPTATTSVVINQTAQNSCRITDDAAVCGSLTLISDSDVHPDLIIETSGSLLVSHDAWIQKVAGAGTVQVVILDQATFTCQDLTIQGYTAGAAHAKLVHEKSTTLCTIQGDLTLQPGAELDLSDGDDATQDGYLRLAGNYANFASEADVKQATSTLELVGLLDQTIATSGFDEVFSTLMVNKPSGNVQLSNSIDVERKLQFVHGDIVTGTRRVTFYDNAVHVGVSHASHVNGKVRKIGNDVFLFPIGNGTYFRPAGITAPAALSDHFTAHFVLSDPDPLYDDAAKDATLDHISSCEYWIIDRTGGSSAVQVELSWSPATSCGVSDPNGLRVARWNGTMWKDHGNTGTTGNADAGTIWSNSVTAFSPFTLASITVLNPLPVVLTHWEVSCESGKHVHRWTTASEYNAAFFQIAYSVDGNEWFEGSSFPAQGATTQASDYQWEASGSTPVYYRLSQVDVDGRIHELGIRVADCWMEEHALIAYPNPIDEVIYVQVTGGSEPRRVELVDVHGKVLQSAFAGPEMSIAWDASRLSAGVYFVRMPDNPSMLQKLLKH